MSAIIKEKIKAAFEEVKRFHPEVTQVFISKNGLWLFCDDSFESPVFHRDIDTHYLEMMVDYMDVLPAAFHWEDYKEMEDIR